MKLATHSRKNTMAGMKNHGETMNPTNAAADASNGKRTG